MKHQPQSQPWSYTQQGHIQCQSNKKHFIQIFPVYGWISIASTEAIYMAIATVIVMAKTLNLSHIYEDKIYPKLQLKAKLQPKIEACLRMIKLLYILGAGARECVFHSTCPRGCISQYHSQGWYWLVQAPGQVLSNSCS